MLLLREEGEAMSHHSLNEDMVEVIEERKIIIRIPYKCSVIKNTTIL